MSNSNLSKLCVTRISRGIKKYSSYRVTSTVSYIFVVHSPTPVRSFFSWKYTVQSVSRVLFGQRFWSCIVFISRIRKQRRIVVFKKTILSLYFRTHKYKVVRVRNEYVDDFTGFSWFSGSFPLRLRKQLNESENTSNTVIIFYRRATRVKIIYTKKMFRKNKKNNISWNRYIVRFAQNL